MKKSDLLKGSLPIKSIDADGQKSQLQLKNLILN